MTTPRKQLLKRGILAASLALFLVLLLAMGTRTELVERFYADGVYVLIRTLVAPVVNAIPFSFGDLVYVALATGFVLFVCRLVAVLIRRRFAHAAGLLLNFVITTEVLGITFYLMWGLNYFRPPAAVRLDLKDSVFSRAELLEVTGLLIDSANAIRGTVSAAALDQGDEAILQRSAEAVLKLTGTLENTRRWRPAVKVSLISVPVSYLGTAGYFNPFTAEAQINGIMPAWLKPLTACHEMAHQMGFGREDEANFVGFLAAKDSGDPLVRYSAYYMAAEEFLFDVMLRDTVAYRQLRDRIAPAVLEDYQADREFWYSYRGAAGDMSSIFYNSYLKFNNQPEGLRTYNRMVGLTLAWYRKNRKSWTGLK